MCADYLIPLTLYQGEDIPQALDALSRTVTSLLQARQAF